MLNWSEVNEFRGRIYKGIGMVCCIAGGSNPPYTPEPTPEEIEVLKVASERKARVDDVINQLESEKGMIGGSLSEEQTKYFDSWIDWLKQYKPVTHREAGNYGGGMPLVAPSWHPAYLSPTFDTEFTQWKDYADKVVKEAEDLRPIEPPPKVSSAKVDQSSFMYKSQYSQVPMVTSKKTTQRSSTPYYQSEKRSSGVTPQSQSNTLYTRVKTGKL